MFPYSLLLGELSLVDLYSCYPIISVSLTLFGHSGGTIDLYSYELMPKGGFIIIMMQGVASSSRSAKVTRF